MRSAGLEKLRGVDAVLLLIKWHLILCFVASFVLWKTVFMNAFL